MDAIGAQHLADGRQGSAKSRRFTELDSLRGLASFTVVITHLSLVAPAFFLFAFFGHTPVALLWAGHQAVVLFFVLSGFVLALPYFQDRASTYGSFVVRRVCRIYVPYFGAVTLAMVLCALLSRGGIRPLGPWFNETWTSPFTVGLAVQHLLLIGDYKNYAYDPVIWSLIIEMRVSLLFPLLVYTVQRIGWVVSLVVAAALTTSSSVLLHHFKDL